MVVFCWIFEQIVKLNITFELLVRLVTLIHENSWNCPLLIVTNIKFLTFTGGFHVLSPQSKVMKYYAACNSYIKTSCFVCILRNVHKVVTNCDLIGIQTRSLITKKEKCVAKERLVLDRLTFRSYFNAAYFNSLFNTILLHILDWVKKSCRHFSGGALRSKSCNFVLFAWWLDQKDFAEIKSCSRSNNGSEIFSLLDVKHKHVAFGAIFILLILLDLRTWWFFYHFW